MSEEREPGITPIPKGLGVKVGMLIAATILIAGGFVLYVLFARGVFEQTQRVILIADNAEGVRVGMNLTFAGFPIARYAASGCARTARCASASGAGGRCQMAAPIERLRARRAAGGVGEAARLFLGPEGPARSSTAPSAGCCAATPARRFRACSRRCAPLSRTLNRSPARVQACRKASRTRAPSPSACGQAGLPRRRPGGEDNAKKLLQTIDRANTLLASLGGVSLKLDAVLSKTTSGCSGRAAWWTRRRRR